jgi:hypothetical protein
VCVCVCVCVYIHIHTEVEGDRFEPVKLAIKTYVFTV